MESMSKNKKAIIGIAVLVVLVAVVAGVYLAFAPKASKGAKKITLQVVFQEGEPKEHTIQTDAEFLGGALEQENLIVGENGEFGVFVKAVDGVTADETKLQWWCFTKGGEQINTGIDMTPIRDGDRFEATLTVGY